jgi:hypothetical protein
MQMPVRHTSNMFCLPRISYLHGDSTPGGNLRVLLCAQASQATCMQM